MDDLLRWRDNGQMRACISSLVVVATIFVACGSRKPAQQGADGGTGGRSALGGAGATSTGGAAASTGGRSASGGAGATSTGGAAAGAGGGGAGGGGGIGRSGGAGRAGSAAGGTGSRGGNGGAGAEGCPATIPVNAGSMTSCPTAPGTSCLYDDGGCSCHDSRGGDVWSCTVKCPSARPTAGGSCLHGQIFCGYGDVGCSCVGKDNPTWVCGPWNCPMLVPAEGSACFGTGGQSICHIGSYFCTCSIVDDRAPAWACTNLADAGVD